MKIITLLFIAFTAILPASCRNGKKSPDREVTMVVVKISDGDTFHGRADGTTYKIRLQGIDAPERGQDFSNKSKDLLGELCSYGPVKVKLLSKDRYGRWVSDVYNNKGQFINEVMVAEGMAWHFKRYSSDRKLDRLEQLAKQEKKGLWSFDNPIPPWEYRNLKKSK
jgi:micrococcal nuclease